MSERVRGGYFTNNKKLKKVKKNKLRMRKKELLELKKNSLERLEDKTISTDEKLEIEALLEIIDISLQTITNNNKVWSTVWNVIKTILSIGIPHLIKALKKNK